MFNKKKKVQDPLRADLAEKINPQVSSFKNSLREANAALLPQEQVVAVTATRDGSVLVLTDKRLINAYKAPVFDIDKKLNETFRLTDINSVTWSGRLETFGKMILNINGGAVAFRGVSREFSQTVEGATL